MKPFSIAVLSTALILGGCELSEEDRENLEEASEDLQKLADQIIITAPASGTTVSQSVVTVRADVPTDLGAQSVTLFVDGIEIAVDSDGAPWELQWPAYYVADGQPHTLLLKTVSDSGVEVRNTQSVQVTVSESANGDLVISGLPDSGTLQEEYSVSGQVAPFELATSYQLRHNDEVIDLTGTDFAVSDLAVGSHSFSYRAKYEYSETTILTGPWSEVSSLEVLPPLAPEVSSLSDSDVVANTVISVTPYVPDGLDAASVSLYVDGIKIASDTDGAPWELEWPAYFMADGDTHSLYVETVYDDDVRKSETIDVQVSSEANNLLSFIGLPASRTIQDQDTVSGSVESVPMATRYQLRHDDNVIDLDSTSFSVNGLGVAVHEFAYRAIYQYSDELEYIGPWSASSYIEVLPPELPTISEPEITSGDTGLTALFSWDVKSDKDEYIVNYRNLADGDISEYVEVNVSNEGSLKVENWIAGEYEWMLTRKNEFGDSKTSDPLLFVSGVFENSFGGSKNDYVYYSQKLDNGDIVVVSKTESSEVTGKRGDEKLWILRLDPLGNILHQLLFDMPEQLLSLDAVEVADGSIIFSASIRDVGETYYNGFIIRLSEDLKEVWPSAITYNPRLSGSYFLNGIVEWNDKVYVSGAEDSRNDGDVLFETAYLHEIDIENAEVVSTLGVPTIDGLTMSINDLVVNEKDNLVIAGKALPEYAKDFDEYYYEYAAFLMEINTDLEIVNEWNDSGKYRYEGAQKVGLFPNGNVVTKGYDFMGMGMIYVFDGDGFDVLATESEYWYLESIHVEPLKESGILFTYVSSTDVTYMQVTDENFNQLVLEKELQHNGYENRGISSVSVNPDNSLTFVMRAWDGSQYDIMVKRIPPLQ